MSRRKGAAFERQIANELGRQLGLTFKRDLRQYQDRELGDLVCTADFPFLIECKAAASGTDCRTAWELQAAKAAEHTGQYPVVIYKFDFHPPKCRVGFDALAEALGTDVVCGQKADLSIESFAWVAREIMAGRACSK